MKKPVQKNIAIESLDLNPDNIRFKIGSKLDGVSLPNTMNTATMRMTITDEFHGKGNFPGRLVIEKRPDGSLIALQGNRRLMTAKEMVNDHNVHPDLRKFLQTLPCDVYEDLTEAERRDLVNDQKSQRFRYSEIVVMAWKLEAAGWTFPQIALELWPEFIAYSPSGPIKEKEINEAPDDNARKSIITTWLKGQLNNEILAAAKLGRRVRAAYLLSCFKEEGNLPILSRDANGIPVYQQPEFNVVQSRCNKLSKLKKQITEAGEPWTYQDGSPAFNALIDTFIAEDNGEAPVKREMPSYDAMATQAKERTQSKAAKVALAYAMGDKSAAMGFSDFDDAAKRYEDIEALLLKYRDGVKDVTVRRMIELFLTGDPRAKEGQDSIECFLMAMS